MKEQILNTFADGAKLSAAEVAAKLGKHYQRGGAAFTYFRHVFTKLVKAGAIVEVTPGVYSRKNNDISNQINLF
jgi:hypothetical protein